MENTKTIRVLLTDLEKLTLMRLIARSSFHSISQYVRSRLLRDDVLKEKSKFLQVDAKYKNGNDKRH